MTIKIKLSELQWPPEMFAEMVSEYNAAKIEYMAHLDGVRADEMNEHLAPEERRVAFPPPTTDPLVERAVAEGYELVGPTLDEKKAALFAKVRQMEAEAIESIIPAAKRRHWDFREQDIHAADRALLQAEYDESGTVFSPDGAPAFLREKRPAEDTQFLTEHEARKAREQAAMRSAARMEHSIADLTEETIDGFEMPESLV